MFDLLRHLRREQPDLPHSMVIKVDVHLVCIASLNESEIVCYLAGGNKIYVNNSTVNMWV